MNFAVFLMGENFLINGQPALQGFFITKGIEAINEEAAAAQAVDAVRADPLFFGTASSIVAAPSTITVKVVHQLQHLMSDTDYLFFPMEEP
ncbi:hypothetical protein [Stenotrophomonas sp. PS02298]|uniref:hypothetical protein n=1 Tax=Stenotrophomonas sp. PS02298 TaxID=2991424 RepID=UPI00249A3356|nr:hypothetical protein [Stenotrophomonas sp. PS02298]